MGGKMVYEKNSLQKVPYEFYLHKYQETDPKEIANRLAIAYDWEGGFFSILFLGRQYLVGYPEPFLISRDDYGEDQFGLSENQNAKILILRYLLYANVFAPNGDYKSFRELPSGELYYEVFQEMCQKRLREVYGSRLDVFARVMETIGAERVDGGDFACEVELFEGLTIRFIFWRGDAEFPPSCQILFSSNFPAAFVTYDLAEIIEICMEIFVRTEHSFIH